MEKKMIMNETSSLGNLGSKIDQPINNNINGNITRGEKKISNFNPSNSLERKVMIVERKQKILNEEIYNFEMLLRSDGMTFARFEIIKKEQQAFERELERINDEIILLLIEKKELKFQKIEMKN